MRKLIFVPIIHASTDMGSLGIRLSESSAAIIGKEIWDEHQKTVARFWDSISQFFKSLPPGDYKIFQDGMIIAGEDGLKIVNEGAGKGSANYAIIADLLHRGGLLIKTEDISLVQKEYGFITKLLSCKSVREKETAALRYKLAQHKLLEDRDSYIAGIINSTLKEGETGILFIGAYHGVLSKLPVDIKIFQVKELTKVREYQEILLKINGDTLTQYQQLMEYLVSPVTVKGIE
jgi:hypothetical protein